MKEGYGPAFEESRRGRCGPALRTGVSLVRTTASPLASPIFCHFLSGDSRIHAPSGITRSALNGPREPVHGGSPCVRWVSLVSN